MFWKIKIVLAVVLLISTFMPLGSCERKQIAMDDQAQSSSNQSEVSTPPKSADNQKDGIVYLIPIKMLTFSEPMTWQFFGTFVWPLPFLAIKGFLLKSKWKRRIGNTLELLLSGFSVFTIYSWVFALYFEPMIWGYIATFTIVLYLIVHLVEILTPYLVFKGKKI